MKKKDGLLCDFHNEKIADRTLNNIVGGEEVKPCRHESVGSNDAHTSGDEGDCDVDNVRICWSLDY